MSEIYAPGSIAGPQGPAGPAGSQGSVTALASSVLPAAGNLFDANKVAHGFSVQSDGTLAPAAGWSSSGLIFCPGMTSMASNLPIDPSDATFALYDANGAFLNAVPVASFGSVYYPGPNMIGGCGAFPLPGTQVYVRFSWLDGRLNGSYGNAASLAGAMVCASTGTAAVPSNYVAFGFATPSDVDAKDAAVAANAATALLSALTVVPAEFAGAVLPGPMGGNRNAFNYRNAVADHTLCADGTLAPNAGWYVATVYAPGSTSFITNLPFYVSSPTLSVCTYDACGNFIADISSTLAACSGIASGRMNSNVVAPLPGNQTYVKFCYTDNSWSSYSYPGSAASCVFYSGNAASPPPASLNAMNQCRPFTGNDSAAVRTASSLGAATDQSFDATAVLNAFLATASATNPIKLILDGMFLTTGLVLATCGHTTIEGTGPGSGIAMIGNSPRDCIRIGEYTVAMGCSEGAYDVAAVARAAKNIVLRDFQVKPNFLSGEGGQTNAAADQPVSGAVAHGTYGILLNNCTDVLIDNITFLEAPANYCVCLSNVGFAKVVNSRFATAGTLHDGIHIDGPSEDIGIENCDFATGDDAIALNSPEGYGGDISRVTVTNCRFHHSLSFVRAYTSIDAAAMPSNNVHRIRNVVVSNCTGVCSNIGFVFGIFGAGLTPAPDVDQIQDFSVSNCTFSSQNVLMLLAQSCGLIRLSGVNYIPTSANPLVTVWNAIGQLTLEGVTVLRNPDGSGAPGALVSLISGSSVDRLALLNCRVVDEAGSSYAPVPCFVDVQGAVSAMLLEAIDLTHVASLASSAGWSGVTALRGGGVLGTGTQLPDSVMEDNTLYLSSNSGGAPSIKVGGVAKRLTLA